MPTITSPEDAAAAAHLAAAMISQMQPGLRATAEQAAKVYFDCVEALEKERRLRQR